jgi:hypothetical protein
MIVSRSRVLQPSPTSCFSGANAMPRELAIRWMDGLAGKATRLLEVVPGPSHSRTPAPRGQPAVPPTGRGQRATHPVWRQARSCLHVNKTVNHSQYPARVCRITLRSPALAAFLPSWHQSAQTHRVRRFTSAHTPSDKHPLA